MTVVNASRHFRGNRMSRLTQPAEGREARKLAQPRPETLIMMPDGTSIDAAEFHILRSTSHLKLEGAINGCAMRIRNAIPPKEWAQLENWLQKYRSKYKDEHRSNDGLLAVLLDYAGSKLRQKFSPADTLRHIIESGTAKALLPRSATA